MAPPRTTARPRHAFTLIELLVVIGVIGVLMGILIPAISGARAQARRLKCLTNLRGWGVAFQLYYAENKERLPYVLPFYDIGAPGVPPDPQDPQLLEVMDAYMDVPAPFYDEAGNLIVTEPYLCPADRDDDAGRVTGLSYQYWAGGLMLLRELGGESTATVPLTVTRFYERTPGFPLMADSKRWHPGGPMPRNPTADARPAAETALYFGDWRADWLLLDPIEEIRP